MLVARNVYSTLALAAMLPSLTALAADEAAQSRPPFQNVPAFGNAGLPPLDCRLSESNLPRQQVLDAIAAWQTVQRAGLAAGDEARLRNVAPSVSIIRDPFLGTPVWIGSTVGYLTGQADNPILAPAPVQAIRDFVGSFTGLVGISPELLDSSHLYRNYVTDHNGVQHLAWQQQVGGIDLFGSRLWGSVDPQGRVINVGSTMIGDAVPALAQPALSAADAVQAAAADAGVVIRHQLTAQTTGYDETVGENLRQKTVFAPVPELRADEPLVAQLVYFPRTRSDIRLAWSVVVPVPGEGHTYDTIVDATDGSILWRLDRLVNDTTQPITFNVFSSDSPAPGSPGNTPANTSFQFPFVPRTMITVTPDQMRPSSPDGWIPDNQNSTLGNNVDSHGDTNADNVADLPRPTGTNRVLDFPYNSASPAPSNLTFAITQMFYWANLYHDRLYPLGFNEVAGNFQTNNFGRGGVGNDALLCDAQDGSGTNNANYNGTGTDGTSGRIQMYVFTGPTPTRDGTIDGDVVMHEITHGTSIRLHNGLTNTQSRSMGEGWSDFFGTSMFAEPTDDVDANYCTGGYVTLGFPSGAFNQNYYFGIRRYPYSTNMSINPLTFADCDPGQINVPPSIPISPVIGLTPADEVHNAGEVWANTLLEGRAGLWHARGFAANDLMMRIVLDGMKLAPQGTPSFITERNAILQADMVSGGTNQIILWRAFAHRGLGSGALEGPSGSAAFNGIHEAFDIPQRVQFTYPAPLPVQLLPGESPTITIDVAPFNVTLVANSGRFSYSLNGAAFTTVPMTAAGTNRYTVTLPAGACLDRLRYYFDVDTDAGRFSDPEGAPGQSYAAQVFTGTAPSVVDDGETDIGWVATHTTRLGTWDRGVPVNFNRGDPPSDNDHVGTGKCWLTDNNPTTSDSDVDNGDMTLTSPEFAASDGKILSYAAWLNSTQTTLSAGDGLFAQYANDATLSNWQTVRSYTTPSNSWRTERLVVGRDIQAPNGRIKFRFVASDVNPGNVIEAGMDSFKIEALVCEESNCPADYNNDGGVDGADVESFFIDWSNGAAGADVNSDGGVDGSDVEYFFVRWQAGGC